MAVVPLIRTRPPLTGGGNPAIGLAFGNNLIASPLQDGFRALITFLDAPAVAFFEKTVKPIGLDGGDAIDETTMHNLRWRTKAPRSLITTTDTMTTVAYDVGVYPAIAYLVNRRTTVTVNFSDGSLLAFPGFLQKFEPSDMKEGEQPEATVTIVCTNTELLVISSSNPFGAQFVESAPVLKYARKAVSYQLY